LRDEPSRQTEPLLQESGVGTDRSRGQPLALTTLTDPGQTHISSMLGWKILFMKPIEGDLNGY
jgi:hypothetical protein